MPAVLDETGACSVIKGAFTRRAERPGAGRRWTRVFTALTPESGSGGPARARVSVSPSDSEGCARSSVSGEMVSSAGRPGGTDGAAARVSWSGVTSHVRVRGNRLGMTGGGDLLFVASTFLASSLSLTPCRILGRAGNMRCHKSSSRTNPLLSCAGGSTVGWYSAAGAAGE